MHVFNEYNYNSQNKIMHVITKNKLLKLKEMNGAGDTDRGYVK